jgi:hypothetical protein
LLAFELENICCFVGICNSIFKYHWRLIQSRVKLLGADLNNHQDHFNLKHLLVCRAQRSLFDQHSYEQAAGLAVWNLEITDGNPN